MGTLNLSNFGLQGVAPLSRDEMKEVGGGYMSPGYYHCNCAGPIGHNTNFNVISNYDDLDVVAAVCDQQYGQGSGYCIAEVPTFYT